MRRQLARDVRVRGRWRRAQDKLCSAHGCGDIRGDKGDCRLMPSLEVLDGTLAASGPMRGHRILVASPKPCFVTRECEITGGCERTVTPAEHGDAHSISSADAYPPGPLICSSFQAELLC